MAFATRFWALGHIIKSPSKSPRNLIKNVDFMYVSLRCYIFTFHPPIVQGYGFTRILNIILHLFP